MQEIQRKRPLKTPFGCKICRKGPPNGPQSMPEGWKMDPQIPCPIGNHFHGVWGTLLAKPSWNEPKTLKPYFSVWPNATGRGFDDLLLICTFGFFHDCSPARRRSPSRWGRNGTSSMERPANASFEKITQHFFSLASGTSQGWDQPFQFDLGGEVQYLGEVAGFGSGGSRRDREIKLVVIGRKTSSFVCADGTKNLVGNR